MAARLLSILSFMICAVVLHGREGWPEGYITAWECHDDACQDCREIPGANYAVTFDKCVPYYDVYEMIHCFRYIDSGKTRVWIGMYTQSDCKGEPFMKHKGDMCEEYIGWPSVKYTCELRKHELRNSAIEQEEDKGSSIVDSYTLIAIFLIVFVIGICAGYWVYTKRKKTLQANLRPILA